MLTYSLWMIALDNKWGIITISVGSFILYYIVALIYGRWWDNLQTHRYLLQCCRFVELLTPFTFGAIAQRLSDMQLSYNIKPCIIHKVALIIAIVMFIYSTFKGIPLYPVYCAFFMIVLANIKYGKWTRKALQIFGKYSMIIWLAHTYYFEVIFKDQILALKYPILVFLSVAVLSLLAAIALDKIIVPITKNIK